MSNIKIPIVIVAYNRPKSLIRILSSLKNANYPGKDIPLIISIDKSDDNQDVLNIAKEFEWKFGPKKVNYEKKNLGLRKHILKCGNLSQEFGAVIVLEDDLYLSPNFYNYTVSALNFSNDKDYIGGISLYNHLINVHTMDNFLPIDDGFDNWYFQFASSWGQAWTRKQWDDFTKWYNKNDFTLSPSSEIPANVTSWSDKSWLKYFVAYLIQKEKYFLYPKIALSTNFSDVGTHVGNDSTAFQVPLNYSNQTYTNFSSLDNSQSVYDAFYENLKLEKSLNIKTNELCVDLYGAKTDITSKYWLTTKKANFKIHKSFGRSLKPIESNIIQKIQGNDIFLYDTTIIEKNTSHIDTYRKLLYNIKYISRENSFLAFYQTNLFRVKAVFKRLFR